MLKLRLAGRGVCCADSKLRYDTVGLTQETLHVMLLAEMTGYILHWELELFLLLPH